MKGDCDGCKKKAVVHIKEIIGGKIVTKNYCEGCPKLTGEGVPEQFHMPINELLTNFVMQHSGLAKEASTSCPACGLTWAEFKQSGLLGCEHDYIAFEKELTSIIQRAHEGATHHVGKSPARRRGDDPASKTRAELSRLRRELAKAVEAEDYERAARLRDQIRQLEHEAKA